MDEDGQDGGNTPLRELASNLGDRHSHLLSLHFWSIIIQRAVSPTCWLIANDLRLLLPIIGSVISALLAGIVLSYSPRNNLLRVGPTILFSIGLPVGLMIKLAATLSLSPCRRLGVHGLIGIAPAHMVTLVLLWLAALGRISAHSEAVVGGVLAAWFAECAIAACAVAAGGTVMHDWLWKEMAVLTALRVCCVLLVAAVFGVLLFCSSWGGRPSVGAHTAFFFGIWVCVSLCPIAAAVREDGWGNWLADRKDVTLVTIFIVLRRRQIDATSSTGKL